MFNGVEYVRKVCKERKIPIYTLEKECGFANGYLNPKKQTKLPYERAIKIAEYLNLDANYLMTGEASEPIQGYYFNDDAKEMAQFMFDHPEYKVLFDATRNVKKDDIEFVKEMIERFTGNNK